MSKVSKTIVWFLVALMIFAVFRWLFGLGLPDAAFQFAAGATIIVVAGLLSGWYVSKLFSRYSEKMVSRIIYALIAGCLCCMVLLGIFVNRMIEQTQFNYFFFGVTALLLFNAFVAAGINLVRMRIKANMRAAKEALTQSKAELQLLQAQISPHFLFNTLNNLYGLSLSDHEKVPGLLLKLSDLLRYSVYDVKEVFVPLANEVNYLENYIEFEKIRLSDRLVLTTDLHHALDRSVSIAPMLLIVFVENAFKHSRDNENDRIFIDIKLKSDDRSIFFSIRNSCASTDALAAPPRSRSGFGLESVKKRLQLLYPSRHQLQIAQSEKEYSVTLLVQLR